MIKSTLKFVALILGLGSLLFGASSCKKDDDDKICCTWTDDGDKYTYCKGEDHPWQDGVKLEGEEWTYFKSYVTAYYNADCD